MPREMTLVVDTHLHATALASLILLNIQTT